MNISKILADKNRNIQEGVLEDIYMNHEEGQHFSLCGSTYLIIGYDDFQKINVEDKDEVLKRLEKDLMPEYILYHGRVGFRSGSGYTMVELEYNSDSNGIEEQVRSVSMQQILRSGYEALSEVEAQEHLQSEHNKLLLDLEEAVEYLREEGGKELIQEILS